MSDGTPQAREVAPSPRALEATNARTSSINVSTTAKGKVTWDIKVYFDVSDNASREHGLGEIQLIDERLRTMFGDRAAHA
jgi:hypothetical protein